MINDRIFTESFRFNLYSFKKYRHNDNRSGIKLHFIALMVRGRARLVSENETVNVSEGEVFFIPKGLGYESFWYGSPHIEFASLGFEFIPTFDGNGYALQTVEADAETKEKILALARSGVHSAEDIGALYNILGSVCGRMRTSNKDKHKEFVIKVKRYIKSHPTESICAIAKKFAVSESGLYLTFKKYSEQTISEYRNQTVMETAENLLTSTDMPIGEISDSLGFSSDSYFRKKFKAHFGISAREMRKKNCI